VVINWSAKRGTVVSETCASRIGGSDDTQGRPSPVPDRNLLSDFYVRLYHWEALVMASNAGIFFAGVGTTFIILGAGFGGGVMLANSALDKPAEYQSRASAEPQSPVRVVLPAPAVAAQPPEQPQQPQQIASAPQPQIQPVQETQPLGEKQASKTGAKKAQAERRKRYAERKARRQAEKAKRQQSEPSDYQEAPVMAFGGDDRREFGYFGD
jgi:outer membrane biosynthesis protein TonB